MFALQLKAAVACTVARKMSQLACVGFGYVWALLQVMKSPVSLLSGLIGFLLGKGAVLPSLDFLLGLAEEASCAPTNPWRCFCAGACKHTFALCFDHGFTGMQLGTGLCSPQSTNWGTRSRQNLHLARNCLPALRKGLLLCHCSTQMDKLICLKLTHQCICGVDYFSRNFQ